MNSATQIQLQATILPDGSLSIFPGGPETVNITYSYDETGAKVATIAFGGVNQAFVTYDAAGQQPVSFTMYNPAPTLPVEQSVQNIVQYFADTPTLH